MLPLTRVCQLPAGQRPAGRARRALSVPNKKCPWR